VLLSGIGTFVVLAGAGLSVIDRYLLMPAVMILIFCAFALTGWTMLERGVLRKAWALGAVVLASDAVHYWMNLAEQNPFPPANVMDALEAFRIVEDLAGDRDHIIPGHDPLVLSRFPPLRGNLDIVRVDLAPTN